MRGWLMTAFLYNHINIIIVHMVEIQELQWWE